MMERRRSARSRSSGSESESERSVEPRKLLPLRSSRGTRIRKLLGEEAEADASFWGQDAWQEDGEDDDYSTEAGWSGLYLTCIAASLQACASVALEDIVDSDFDEEEAPDDDVHDGEADEEAPRRKRRATTTGKYREPLQSRPMKRAAVVKAPTTTAAATASEASTFEYVAPTVRSSTARKTSVSSELRRRASGETARLAAMNKKPPVDKASHRLTQAQLLAEAVRTEVENSQSLQRLEQLEEEKKAESVAPKAPFTGRMIRYYSRIGALKTITFLNTHEFPSLFNQPKPKKRISSQQQKLNRLRFEAEEKADEEDEDEDTAEEEDDDKVDAQSHGLLQQAPPSAAKAVA
ncbi:hypothetical protein BBJ28_00004498 [Nothophytophthora sp. Chile5]|nr:hypothetical protein BBJ28_00004498 [Nothophytophthora sp. Chile5]